MLLLRLCASSRDKREVDEKVLRHCHMEPKTGKSFATPPLRQLLNARVVVATLAVAARLHLAPGVPRGHFSGVMIDEAGHALEPEAIAPVAMLLGADGQLVLAGDPRQLGPVVHSEVARAAGYGISLLERLVKRKVYAAGSTAEDADDGEWRVVDDAQAGGRSRGASS
eukprot:417621-Prymnesium_polylepis.1